MHRRSFLAGSSLGAAAMTVEVRAQGIAPGRKAIVLVHGAWHGGWCWGRVKPLLEQAGHPVSALTLTGLGERRHLISRSVVLDTHIQDVVQHIENEELSDIVLVGHSYGGFVVTGAVELLGRRVAHLILVDGFFPKNGESVLDYAGERRRAELAAAAKDTAWNIPAPPASFFGVTKESQGSWVERHLSAQPFGVYAQPLRVEKGVANIDRRSYLSCDAPALPVLDTTRERIKSDPSWRYVGLTAPHDVMVTHPHLLVDAVLRLVA
jgi:pimeloyl-ACP methyl ester carboxylesterase